MYALNIDAETGRVLSATYPQYAPENAPQVAELPEGDLVDYLYQDGELVYDPIPREPVEETPSLEDQIAELREQNDMLLECLLEMSEIVYA